MSESKVLVQDTITAATSQTLAGARASLLGASLSPDAGIHIISTVANLGDAVGLPVADKKLSGRVKKIINKSDAYAKVFPDTGGVITCLKGALAEDASYTLHGLCSVELQTSDGKNWSVISESGSKSRTVTAATTLTVADDGATVSFVAGAAYAITIPAVATGCKFKFVKDGAGANAVTITSPGTDITGKFYSLAETPTIGIVSKTASATLPIASGAPTGTWAEFASDGADYWATGIGGAATSFT